MKLNSLVDPKKREQIREAIRKKDASLLPVSKKPLAQPLVDEQLKEEVKETPEPAPQASPPQQQKQTPKKTRWSHLSDDELVEKAKKVIDERGITTKRELATDNNGLYHALQKCGLLKKAFE